MGRFNWKTRLASLATAALLIAAGISASAAIVPSGPFTGSGTSVSGDAISASVSFSLDTTAKTLTVTLANTAASSMHNDSVLMAVYFGLSGTTLAPKVPGGISASGGLTATPPTGQSLGGGWAYNPAAGNGATGQGQLGASTWGNSSLFWASSPNPPPNAGVDGVNYGIIDSSGLVSGNQLNGSPFAIGSVTFVFDITGTVPTDLSGLKVTGFSYGTDSKDYTFVSVPEPTTVVAGALLLLPFGLSTLRVLRRNRAA